MSVTYAPTKNRNTRFFDIFPRATKTPAIKLVIPQASVKKIVINSPKDKAPNADRAFSKLKSTVSSLRNQ